MFTEAEFCGITKKKKKILSIQQINHAFMQYLIMRYLFKGE